MTDYVDNKAFYDSLVEYNKQKKKNPDIKTPEYVGKCILLICQGLAQRPNFNGYTFKSDMISDGIEDAVAAVKNFNPNKSKNPFGYFTQIAYWAFVQRILIEKKQQYLKHKNYQNNFMLSELSNTDRDSIEKQAWSDLSDQVIESFESKLKKTLTKNKKASIVKKKVENTSNVQSKKNTSNSSNREGSRRLIAKRVYKSKH